MIFHRVPANGAGPVHGMIVAFLYIVFQEFFTKKRPQRFSYGLIFWGVPHFVGRAVALSHDHFKNNNKVAVRLFSL